MHTAANKADKERKKRAAQRRAREDAQDLDGDVDRARGRVRDELAGRNLNRAREAWQGSLRSESVTRNCGWLWQRLAGCLPLIIPLLSP